jgi:hypothetical protein
MKITFDIPTPSLNKLTKSRWACLNWKKKFLSRLKNYELLALRKKKRTGLTIQRHGSRILDKDNYCGGCKPLIDAIKEKGLIVDDRPEWCNTVFLEQIKCRRGQEKVIVSIEEI